MDDKYRRFVKELSQNCRELDAVLCDEVAAWKPEDPPLTLVFGALGQKIAESFSTQSHSINEAVFAAIERAMASEDDSLATVVATGLIEGLIGSAFRQGNWADIRPMLGAMSGRHADAWVSA